MDSGSILSTSAFAPSSVSYVIAVFPVTYVFMSRPDAATASATADLRSPMESIADMPSPNWMVTMYTPEEAPSWPKDPMIVLDTPSPNWFFRASSRHPFIMNLDWIEASCVESSYGMTRTTSVLNEESKYLSTSACPSADSESRPPIAVIS